MNNNIVEMADSIINISNLTKRYQNKVALSDISVDFPKGKIVGLLGPNGSGKTTLIKILVNLLMKYDGKVSIDGHEPGIDTKAIVSYLPDVDYIDPNWTFIEATKYFKDFYSDFDDSKAMKLVKELKIPTMERFKCLSKGTREKLQLILVLSRNAKVYIFDEPIAGVDPVARDVVFRLITENRAPGSTVIISTHLILDIQDYLDYVIFLKNGKVVLRNDCKTLTEATGKSINEVFKEVFKYV